MAIRYDLTGERKRPVFGRENRSGDARGEKQKETLTMARALQGFFIIAALTVLATAIL